MEKIKITILPGGVVKVETDKISGPNHLSADRLLRGIEEDLGGETVVQAKRQGVLHTHERAVEHQ